MTEDSAEEEQSESGASGSFEAFLRQAARVSVPVIARSPVLSAGSTLAGGRLSIVKRLGEGGMGVVYEAFDAQRRLRVALKTLSRVDAGGIYRLKAEFRTLADVTHEHLVRLHELFSDDALWFFTMDLVAGVPFDAWVRAGGELDTARLRTALAQLADAVSAVHAAGKLHRDLKPSNVLVTPEGRVVVLDFGLAVDPELGGVGQTIADESVSGTPGYMAPEQAAGQPATQASDFYALGVMLFEALTGKLPFAGRAVEMMAAKQRDEAPRASTLASNVPADLDALCAELLSREPISRPDATALRARLGVSESLGSRPSRSIPAPLPPQLLGRDAELAALRDAYAASCTGHKPVIVLLSGESGIGKSALCEVVLSELRAQGHAVVLSGRCFERESVPFKAFDLVIDALSRHLRKLGDGARDLVPREAYALRRLFPVLGRIPAIAEAPERQVPDPHELRQRAFLALGELLGRIRDRQPLVLHLDDLQWSDTDSTVLLMHLVRQPDAPKLLLIASHRSEQMQGHPYLQPLYDALPIDIRLDTTRMSVGPLPPDAAQALLHGQLERAPEDLVKQAGGNPFLLSELARHAAEHAHAPATELSLEYVVVARAAALAEPERRLLQVLAVASRPIDLALAVEAAGVDAGPRTLLEALTAAHLARSTGDKGEVECFHDKVREALLGALTPDALRELHQALAGALFTRSRSGEPVDAEQLAVHLLGAGYGEEAALQLARAADQAMTELSFDRAARLYGQALELGRFAEQESQRLRVARADALSEAGRGPLAAEAYLDAMQHVTGEAAHALEHRAADQYLFSGHLEQGRALLAGTLARHGIRLPASKTGAMASLVYERARLRLRGLEFRERPSDPGTTDDLELLATSARALGGLDFVRAASLSARHLRLALDAGDAEQITLGLDSEVWNAALGIGNADAVPALLAKAESLLERSELWRQAHYVRALFHFQRGCFRYMGPDAYSGQDAEGALADFDRFLVLSRERPGPNATYDRAMAEQHRVNVRAYLARFAEVARELPALCDDAWGRGDAAVLPLFAGGGGALALIAVGALEEAQFQLARASAAWSACRSAYTFQDCFLLQGDTLLAAARGEHRAAFERAQRDLVRFTDSPLRASPVMSDSVTGVALGTAAALAATVGGGTERAELVRRMRRFRLRGPQPRAFRTAMVAALEGRRDAVIETLRGMLAAPVQPMPTHVFRRHLGRLLGGDEGRAMVTEADAFLRTGGVVDPERFADLVTSGLSALDAPPA